MIMSPVSNLLNLHVAQILINLHVAQILINVAEAFNSQSHSTCLQTSLLEYFFTT